MTRRGSPGTTRPRTAPTESPRDAGRTVGSAPATRWRVLVGYAGLAAEVFVAIVIGFLIMGLALMV